MYLFPFVMNHIILGLGKLFGGGVKIAIFAIFSNFEANFLKRVHPYGSKNIFPQPFPPKGLWV